LNPALEAAYARVRSRATSMQNELTEMENDLAALFDEANKEKIEKRVEKLGATRRGDDIENRMEKLNEGMKAYSEAIAQLKGINEGFLETVKSA
jgi:predicted  nucleic acid-binding Zn-ribbon protein